MTKPHLSPVVSIPKASRRKAPFWFSFNVDEWQDKTFDLSALEAGAYINLLTGYWRSQGPITDDNALLARLARVDARTWQKIRATLQSKFDVMNGVWSDARMNQQIARAISRSAVNQRNREGGAR